METDLSQEPLVRQIRTWLQARPGLLQEHEGRWVVVRDTVLEGAYGSYDEAADAARARGLDPLECLIVRVVEPAAPVSTWGA